MNAKNRKPKNKERKTGRTPKRKKQPKMQRVPKKPLAIPKRHPKAGEFVLVSLGPGVHQKHTLKVVKAREDIKSPDGQISVEVKLDYDHLTVMHKSHNGAFPYWEWPE